MTKVLFVPKTFNTYADPLRLLGLARLVEDALLQTRQEQNIQLINAGTHYRLELKSAIDLDKVAQMPYSTPFLPVKGAKTQWDKMPPNVAYFDVEENKQQRKLFREYQIHTRGSKEWNEEVPKPPDARSQNGVILTSLRPNPDRNHNGLWQESWKIREQYGEFLSTIFQALSQPHNEIPLQQIAKKISLPKPASAVKLYQPVATQGVNQLKADSISFKSQTMDWLSLWLIANGFFEFALCDRVKVADKTYDWRVVVLEPYDIALPGYRLVLDKLRIYNPPSSGYGIACFDAELVLKFYQEQLNYHRAKIQDNPNEFSFFTQPNNNLIQGFSGAQFNSKGQVHGVKTIFNLGLPAWIQPQNYQELGNYSEVIDEHLKTICFLANQKDENGQLLNLYRNFITGINIYQFFPFQSRYADYCVKKYANADFQKDKLQLPALFTTKGLNLMTKKDSSISKITSDSSFLRIAKAINHATIHAGKIKTKEGVKDLDWQRQYGLAQQISSQSGSRRELIAAIAEFLGKYEHENLRLQEQYLKENKSLFRVQPTKEDIDRLIEIIEENDPVLVGNLLIAYGYARWPSTQEKPDSTET
ncbi:MAG: hypothetical protein SAJ12_06750 [Jaaginema sp. PMC 1079.18]|nr:hypothetical protein [Jaaginema sp. PMC 1080.18]MEC4850693.1 hypothetical protein [Jaaginema sp. PMC 1079.18]MEC4866758.1 hypothetical protein [Jaaginema sp. PMC 1078.18]